ncbi:diguanylate cyclase (GGDEF)-like protein/PAS domain S-box-containing protein [Rhodoblastus acidophilus]|uniref:sensor domain-containing protein n=1 Tax=Rhodoblastus acidophilus TaxID=1074 RepID=UPI002224AA88|nr:EAL domain-containing protein [Rhodoblastus acidophilus]MCW2284128.1 diguanylate cyclase (GGDEF)-like protein/PAS domain S-box-containing protein [Rhodoblastus acidophilus]MCW2332824.1 diguanylate cyclase (GGDEF)-like protein/PAS domain S-box-containing protein [Rhodoblastus acidophilus]
MVLFSTAWTRAREALPLAKLGALQGWPRSARMMGGAGVFLIALAVRIAMFGVGDLSFPFLTYLPGVALSAALFGRAGGVATFALSLGVAHPGAPLADELGWYRTVGFIFCSLAFIAGADFARATQARLHAARLALQNEAQLSHFVAEAPAIVAMFDRNMRYLACSRRWRAGLGVDDGVLGRAYDEALPETPVDWKDVHLRGLAGETVRLACEPVILADGTQQWIRSEVQPWRRPDGEIGGLVIFVDDLTESVSKQEATRQSEAALRALGDNLPDSVVYRLTADRDGAPRFLYISAGVAQLNGVSAEEILADGRKLVSQVLSDHAPALQAAKDSCARAGADLCLDVPMRRPDGAVRWMRLRARPDPRPDGAVIWNGVYTDVSEEIWAEAVQREETRRQAFVLELADALKPLGDPLEIMTTASEILGRALACNKVVYAEVDETQQLAITRREWTDGAMPLSLGAQRLAHYGAELIGQLKAGEISVIHNTAADPRAAAAAYAASEIGAFISAPLIKDGRLVAVLCVLNRETRYWTALDIRLIEEAAERTWAAVERARAAQALRDGEERLRLALRAANAGVWSWNIATRDGVWSEELWSLYGLDPRAATASYDAWLASVHPGDREATLTFIADAMAAGRDFEVEWRTNAPPGAERWLLSRAGPLRDPDGAVRRYTGVVLDITGRKKSEQKIGYLAHHDTLTGLPNRAAFNQRLADAIAGADEQQTSVAILCMDLDRFKEVNDVFGHAVGDELLRRVANALLGASRGSPLARVGGDEFMMLVTGKAPAARATELARRLCDAASRPMEIEGRQIRIGLSVGVALYPDHGDRETALANADAALYRAKSERGSHVCLFDSGLDSRLRERNALFQDLGEALERDQLSLHYQPQVNAAGEIFGFEALLRWLHPQRGFISPDVFIPIAEERGLIVAVGEWVLREACREAASWPNPLSVAVNLSPVQFQKDGLAGAVHAILMETGLSARRLELEITEGVLVDDFARVTATLRQLKAMGVRVAIDDFGAGYSSLAYLQSFPFDKIKIDRSFVAGLPDNGNSQAIVRAIVGLGRGLGVPLIAEGVETSAQLDFLRAAGCGEAQGFLIGAPEPIAAYAGALGGAPAPAFSRRQRI